MKKIGRIPRLKALMWGGFTLGGVIAAFVVPVLILLTNLAVPLGLLQADRLQYASVAAKLANPWAKLFIVGVVGGTLYHSAYRLQSTLDEISIGRLRELSWVISYGLLAVGIITLLYGLLLLR